MSCPAALAALLLAPLASLAHDAQPAPERAPAEQRPAGEWQALDQRLEALSDELRGAPPSLRAWLQSSWRASSSGAVAAATGGRLSGFGLDTARLLWEPRRDDWGGRVELELAPGELAAPGEPEQGFATVLDAYLTWWQLPEASWSLGRFRRPFLRSGLLQRDALLFLDRSALGSVAAQRSEGLLFVGSLDTLRSRAAVQDGGDGDESRLLYSLRFEIEPFGRDLPAREGARAAPEELAMELGLALAFDDGTEHGLQYGVDLALAQAPFSFTLEAAWFDEGPFGTRNPLLEPVGAARPIDGTHPWAASASVALLEIQELALRWQSSDDDARTSSVTAAFARHLAAGSARWVAQWEHVFTDDPAGDFDLFSLGLLLSL